jgi:AraC-like DNA-binding protein
MSGSTSDTAVSLPAPVLRPFITRYAGFRASGVPPGVHIGLPKSDVDLIISLGPRIDVVRMPGSTQRPAAFTALVNGLQDAPAIVRQGTEVFGLHVFIRPLGVRAILGVPSAGISSLVVHLSDIWGGRADDLVGMLLEADTWRRRFDALDQAFVAKLTLAHVQPEIAWAWNTLAASHGCVPVQALADETGYSRRHLSERFRDAIGVTPKLAARVFRFERACRLIAEARASLAHVAVACGYYDQAHLTREWHALTGSSPRAWITRELPFLQDYELGGRDNDADGPESVHQPFVRRPVRGRVQVL